MDYPADYTDELAFKPICGVISVAMIAGVTFARATEVIKKNMLPHQKRHGGATYHEQRCNALKDLGIAFREIPVEGKPTLRKVVRECCRKGKTYMITTSRHVVTVRDGLVADQLHIDTVENHRSRRCITRTILEIL